MIKREELLHSYRLSLYRRFEMALLEKQNISGLVVDLGGAEISGYHLLMPDADKIIRVNIDPAMGCDIIANIESKIPFSDNSADCVLCLNVLEHIFNYQNVISEAYRLLKPGGKMYLATPFIFQIHASPDDFFRFSDSALQRILGEAQFKGFTIIPMGYGLLTATYQLMYGVIPVILRKPIENMLIWLDRKISAKIKRCSVINFPMGYFTVAIK